MLVLTLGHVVVAVGMVVEVEVVVEVGVEVVVKEVGCVCVCVHTCTPQVGKSKDNLLKLILFFYHMGAQGHWTWHLEPLSREPSHLSQDNVVR